MKDFAKTVADFIDTEQKQKFLAERFEVAISTLKKWANGAAAPHPKIQELIVQEIKNYK